jgi:predicted kinase
MIVTAVSVDSTTLLQPPGVRYRFLCDGDVENLVLTTLTTLNSPSSPDILEVAMTSLLCSRACLPRQARSIWTGSIKISFPKPHPTVVFTAGAPGSGKTFVVHNLFDLNSFRAHLDLDHAMRQHPLFDPLDQTKLYSKLDSISGKREAYLWADARIEEEFRALVQQSPSNDMRLLVDGTGTNVPRTLKRMEIARNAGFHVVLVYVRCSKEAIIRRTKRRERNVPNEVIEDYLERMDASIKATVDDERRLVQQVIEMDNDLEAPYGLEGGFGGGQNEMNRLLFDPSINLN